MNVSQGEKSNGFVKPIIAGVVSTVLATVILVSLGIVPSPVQSQSVQSPKDDNAKQVSPTTDTAPPTEPAQFFSISGTWQSTAGLPYIIGQSGSAVTIQEINAFGIVTAEGQGIIVGRDIDISYVTAAGTSGSALLTVSDDGSRITGTFEDLTIGSVIPATLFR